MIWVNYFGNCSEINYIHAECCNPWRTYCTHRLVPSFRDPRDRGRVALLRVNTKINFDVERFLYSGLKGVNFYYQGCLANYLRDTCRLGPLRWTATVVLFMSSVTAEEAHEEGARAAQSLTLLFKKMQSRDEDLGESSDWTFEIEPTDLGFPKREGKPVKWTALDAILSRSGSGRSEVATR